MSGHRTLRSSAVKILNTDEDSCPSGVGPHPAWDLVPSTDNPSINLQSCLKKTNGSFTPEQNPGPQELSFATSPSGQAPELLGANKTQPNQLFLFSFFWFCSIFI